MEPNLWLYADETITNKKASALILLGIQIFNDAKIIKDLDLLEKINEGLDNKTISPENEEIQEFFPSYLIDCVKILIFFENYMKAELIINDFCVHNINHGISEFKNLAKKQREEPVSLEEISLVEPFRVIMENQEIFHRAIKETTLGMNDMIKSKKYLKYFRFNNEVLEILKELLIYRNKLHFHESMSFYTSQEKIKNLKAMKSFVTSLENGTIRVAVS